MDNSDKTRTSSHDSWVVWDLNGYLDGISLIKNEMANVEPEESAKHYFFRGQASYDWNVMPGIFRNGMLAHEYDKLMRPIAEKMDIRVSLKSFRATILFYQILITNV